MSKETTLNELMEALKEHFGETYEVTHVTTSKNNGVVSNSIMVKQGNAYPVFHVDSFLSTIENRMLTVSDAVDLIVKAYESISKDVDFMEEWDKITNRSFLLDHVECQLINAERNRKLMDETPHKDFLNLAIIYQLLWDDFHLPVSEALLQETGKSLEELDEAARKNTRTAGFSAISIDEIIPMYIVTNHKVTYGANVLLFPELFANLAQSLQDDLWLIPSSIHEVLLTYSHG